MKNTAVLITLAFLLASCAAAPPKYSRADLASATTQEQGASLYQSLKAELAADSSGPNAATYRQLMTELGDRLGKEEAARIWNYVNNSQLGSGNVPLSILKQASQDAERIREWNPGEYTRLAGDLGAKHAATESAIENERRLQERLDPSRNYDVVPRVESLGRVRDLYGENIEADHAYQIAYEDAHNQLRIDAEQAMRIGAYDEALQAYTNLQRLDPDFPDIESQITAAQSGMESFDFQQLLIEGNIEGAIAAFLRLSSRPLSYDEKQRFLEPAGNLADYFANTARNLVKTRQYAQAYESIRMELNIRSWMNEPSQIDTATLNQFTDAMFNLSLAARRENRIGLEYGYLLLTAEFNPDYHTLESELRETSEMVYDKAIRRVGSVLITSSDPTDQQIASQIAAGVREFLMKNIPEDVKIVEREKIEDIRREREMSDEIDEHSDSFQNLESADYLIRGELLTADVALDVKRVKSRKRVVTGQEEVRNPAHEDWVREKGVRKADHPDAPPRMITRDVNEDIELVIEDHRKTGEVGVTYRVIDTYSAELVHSETVIRNMKVSDQSQEGVQVGQFMQEVKIAELPSDLEIFTELVDLVVEAVAIDLVGFLKNPEGDYFQNCKVLVAESEFTDAAEQCASAAVLREYKTEDNTEVLTLLKQITLSSDTRAY